LKTGYLPLLHSTPDGGEYIDFPNSARYGAIIRLARNKNVEELKDFFQLIVRVLQNRYDKVSHHYYDVKYHFLSGI
jgi:hypothetical protein